MDLLGEVKTWQPVTGSGRRRYDDHAFVDSVRRQWQTKHRLSPRQLAALARVLRKYKDQLANFDARWQELGLTLPDSGPAAATEVVCPSCGAGKLARKHYRGRTFYGCQAYPTCRYTVSSLDKVAPAAAGGAPPPADA